VLEIRVLGGLEVVRDGEPAALPPSRKTRALLGYLALTPGRHRREQLCELLWDVPDDPRGSLRWSLSKIRPIVDEASAACLLADRQSVELRADAIGVDFLTAQSSCTGAGTDDLVEAARSFRGPLLSDLDLPESGGFHTWLLAMREDARKLRTRILRTLIERFAATPEEALPYARELVGVEPFDEDAWALLITTLTEAGRRGELRPQFEAGLRALHDVGGGFGSLLRAWRASQAASSRPVDREAKPAASVAAQRASIVVLPFANLSDDPAQQYFADGITCELTTDLSRIPDMLVISRNTAFTYKNRAIDTRQIGRDLGVRCVLEGEVQRAGDQVRVTVQLIDAESDAHLWAERFAAEAGDLFALQDQITRRIAVALDLELVELEALRQIEAPDTRDYILRGRAMRLRPPSRENRAEQVLLFERALALDPQSVGAQGWLAIELAARAVDLMTDTVAADIARAEDLAKRALGAAPRYSVARFAMAQVLRAQHRYGEAISEYEAVIALNRNWAHAYSHLGWCKFMTGLVEALIPAQEEAIRLSPRDPQIGLFYSRIGRAHLLQSRIDEAIIWCEKACNATPAAAIFRSFLASAWALKGEMARAVAELDEAHRLVGDDRYSSIARVRGVTPWGAPAISKLAEATYLAGLRMAGMPEE
jgi:TolB-like protein